MKRNLLLALWLLKSSVVLLPRTSLWVVGVVEARRFAKSRWWSKPPFLPIPSGAYWEFRMETIYGDPKRMPSSKDLVEYLQWCLEIR